MTSEDTGGPSDLQTALIVGVSDERRPDGRRQIGLSIASHLASLNYNVYLVGEELSLDRCKSEVEEARVNPDTVVEYISADMKNVRSVLAAIPEICKRQYDIVILNAYFDLVQSSFPYQRLNIGFKVNVLNYWLIAHYLFENVNNTVHTRFAILPSYSKGLSPPSTKFELPMEKEGFNRFFDKDMNVYHGHFYTRLALIAMSAHLNTRMRWPRKAVTSVTIYPDDRDDETDTWAEKVLHIVTRVLRDDLCYWVKGNELVFHIFSKPEMAAFARFLDDYVAANPFPLSSRIHPIPPMTSNGKSTAPISLETALIVGVSDERRQDGRRQIALSVACHFASLNYNVYLVGGGSSLNRCKFAVEGARVNRNTAVEYIPADMRNAQSILDAIPEILQRQYDIVILNAHFDLAQSDFPCELLNINFKVNVLNYWLIAHHLVKNVNNTVYTRFAMLPSFPKGLSDPPQFLQLPIDRAGYYKIFDKNLDYHGHFYTRLSLIGMAAHLFLRMRFPQNAVTAVAMYPDDKDDETDLWAEKVIQAVFTRRNDLYYWVKGNKLVRQGFSNVEMNALAQIFDEYVAANPLPNEE